MVIKYLIIIQLVNAVTARDNDIWLLALLQEIDVLIHGIRCSAVPPAVIHGYCRIEYKQSALFAPEIPPLGGAQMLV